MSRHYSVREFFRQTPNGLLKRYFQARGLFGELDFGAMPEMRPHALLEAWNGLSDDDRKPMEAEFGEIFDPLRRREFQFVYGVDSGIKSVAVRRMRLSSKLRQGDRILVEANTSENRLALYDLLEDVGRSLPLGHWNVTWAEISAQVLKAGDQRAKAHTFHVSWPNACSLKYDDTGLRLRAMLKASGIEPK